MAGAAYHVRMGNRWGSEHDGSGGDGSGHSGTGDGAWRDGGPEVSGISGPQFGEHGETRSAQQSPSEWRSSFGESDDARSSGNGVEGGSLRGQLLALGSSTIGVIVFAVFAYRMGMDLWWIFLGVGIPLISRVVRLLRKNLWR